jgi:hypothetical protein
MQALVSEESIRALLRRCLEDAGHSLSGDARNARALVDAWLVMLSIGQVPRSALCGEIEHALAHELAAVHAASIARLLEFATSVQADSVLRPASSFPPGGSASYPLAALAPPANAVLAPDLPHISAAVSLWRSRAHDVARPAVAATEPACFLLAPPPKPSLKPPALKLPEELDREAATAAADTAENRAAFVCLVSAIAGSSVVAAQSLGEQLVFILTPVAPMPSALMYAEVLPRQPMFERDVLTRRLFAQNPVLLDLVELFVGLPGALPIPVLLFHSLFSLVAASPSLWFPERRQARDATLAHTAQLIAILRRAQCLPWPVSHVDEVLPEMPARQVYVLLIGVLHYILDDNPLLHPPSLLSNPGREEKLVSLMHRTIQGAFPALAPHFARFFAAEGKRGPKR